MHSLRSIIKNTQSYDSWNRAILSLLIKYKLANKASGKSLNDAGKYLDPLTQPIQPHRTQAIKQTRN